MAKKVKKKIVEVETGEVVGDIDKMLDARYVIDKRLHKTLVKKENIESDIDSMIMSLEFINEKLREAGYEEGSENNE